MTDAETAVLDAARKWIEAKEAMLAVDESREGDPTETGHALDQAKYELTEAVYRLIGRELRRGEQGENAYCLSAECYPASSRCLIEMLPLPHAPGAEISKILFPHRK